MKKFAQYMFRRCLPLLLALFPLTAFAQQEADDAPLLVQKVRELAPSYVASVKEYRAELYVKGSVKVHKKNFLVHYLPSMFHVQKGVKDYVIETTSDLHYTYPDIYDEKLRAFTGTADKLWEADGRLPDFFHINVYASSLLGDKLLSPFAPNAHHYYKYSSRGEQDTPQGRIRRIFFVRRGYSYQLLYGYITINEQTLKVREILYIGHTEMTRFNIRVVMGEEGTDVELLPVRYEVEVTFKMLGNKMDGRYVGIPRYTEIRQEMPEEPENKYDLTAAYSLTTDATAVVRDAGYMAEHRPEALSRTEREIYRKHYAAQDSLNQLPEESEVQDGTFWEGMEDILFSRRTVNMEKYGNLRINEVLDPSLLSFSHTNGVSYRYKIRYNRLFCGDRLLRITPRLGLNFKHGELYWSLSGEFNYLPEKRSSVLVDMGSGGRIYSGRMEYMLDRVPDDLFDKSQLHIEYFKDFYAKLMHSWEITNGLTFQAGVSIHQRRAPRTSKYVLLETGQRLTPQQAEEVLSTVPDVDAGMLSNIRSTYNSFAPRVILQWVPGQYYYMNGARKENLGSRYPAVTFDWERGVNAILSNPLEYERMEVDIRQTISLGTMRELYLRGGAGAFTNQTHLYFADFEYLRRNNLPDEWRDEISGRFQLLQRRMYNRSSKYVRFHATYDTPFLLVPHLTKLSKHIIYERAYLNVLFMPTLNPYWEVGYGFGTHVVDLGVFVSFEEGKYQRTGIKISYQLFKR